MKIAIVTELFSPSIGGQEIRFQELGEELCSNGHQVRIYTIHFDLNSNSCETINSLEIIRLAKSPGYKSKRFRRNPIDIIRFTASLFKRRKELKEFDAVIFNIWPVLPQFILGPLLAGKAYIDICETRGGIFWNLVYKAFKLIPKVRITCVNPEISRHMQRVHGFSHSQCETIVSGVDLNAAGDIPTTRDKHRILFFGRMTAHKNPNLLVTAFHESGIANLGYSLEMAGSGPELEVLKSTASFPGVTYHGRVTEEEKWNLLRSVGLLVMPSQREGFPRVVAEAACVGTPTLSLDYPDNGTCSVVRDYKIGKICPPTKSSLMNELKLYAENNSSFDSFSEVCKNQARNQFAWPTVRQTLTNFILNKGSDK